MVPAWADPFLPTWVPRHAISYPMVTLGEGMMETQVLKRIGTDAAKKDIWRGLIIPLFLGFSALFVALTFTHLSYE